MIMTEEAVLDMEATDTGTEKALQERMLLLWERGEGETMIVAVVMRRGHATIDHSRLITHD